MTDQIDGPFEPPPPPPPAAPWWAAYSLAVLALVLFAGVAVTVLWKGNESQVSQVLTAVIALVATGLGYFWMSSSSSHRQTGLLDRLGGFLAASAPAPAPPPPAPGPASPSAPPGAA